MVEGLAVMMASPHGRVDMKLAGLTWVGNLALNSEDKKDEVQGRWLGSVLEWMTVG